VKLAEGRLCLIKILSIHRFKMGKIYYIFIFFSVAGVFAGCSTVFNPATGQEHLSLITTQKEISIGKSLSKRLEDHFGLVNDLDEQLRLEKIGENLSNVSSRQEIIYHFDILEEDEPNAVSLPGGYVYINKGLFDKLETDAQIASVVAHEMAHIEARHSIHRLQKALGYTALMAIVSSNTIDKSRVNRAINELFLNFSREDEFEADRLALRYLFESGYDPHAMLEVLDELKQIKREEPIKVLHSRTHPYIYDRIREIRILLDGKMEFVDYINESYDDKK